MVTERPARFWVVVLVLGGLGTSSCDRGEDRPATRPAAGTAPGTGPATAPAGDTLEELVEQLRFGTDALRDEAAVALIARGEEAVGPVTRALADVDPEVRATAAFVLGEIGSPRAIGPLRALLVDGEEPVRLAAAEALSAIAPEAPPSVPEDAGGTLRLTPPAGEEAPGPGEPPDAAPDVDDVARLAERRDVARLEAVVRNSECSDAARLAAVAALAKVADEAALRALGRAVTETDPPVQVAAARALAGGGGPAADRLVAVAADLAADAGRTPRVLAEVTAALVSMGRPAVKPLSGLLAADARRSGKVRRYAAWTLGRIGGTEAAEALAVVLGDDDGLLRVVVVDALVRVGAPAVDSLIEAAKDAGARTRAHALEALGRIGGERAPGVLIGALSDRDRSVRYAGVRGLERVGGRRAIKALEGALTDEDELVRTAAADALKKLR